MLKSYIKEATTTTGTGDLTLTALTGFARFLGTDNFVADATVKYAIENGDNKETGRGIIRAGNILERTTPQVTLVAGVYDSSSPVAITLVGDSIVFCDINSPASATDSGFLSSTDYVTFAAKIAGSGTINTVPKFTASGTIGNSSITDDSIVVTTTEPLVSTKQVAFGAPAGINFPNTDGTAQKAAADVRIEITDTAAQYYCGAYSQCVANPSGVSSGAYFGNAGDCGTKLGNTQDQTGMTLYGNLFNVYHRNIKTLGYMVGVASYPVQWDVAGTVNTVLGFGCTFFNSTGTFVDGYGYQCDDISNQCTNSYALRLETQSVITGNHFAIWSDGGKSYHAGKFGFGVTAPTANIHIQAGTATANTAPLKLNSGTLLTTPEAGAIEYRTDAYYVTTTTGAKRRMLVAGTTGRATAQTAANGSVATYTLGATDASYEVSANVLVTTSSTENFTVTCAYTDEGNTARTLTLNFSTLAGVLGTAIAFANGAVPYEGVPMHIRCKASTAITIATTGTFTGSTYNAEGVIKQMA